MVDSFQDFASFIIIKGTGETGKERKNGSFCGVLQVVRKFVF